MRLPIAYIRKTTIDHLKKQVRIHQQQIDAAEQFVRSIARGDLDVQYADDDGDDRRLPDALMGMRDRLRSFAEEEQQRRWATEGLAQSIDILRVQHSGLPALAESIITWVVRYMQANQGALYLVGSEDQATFLEMTACVAYDRKKHLHQRFDLGHGLIGQVVLEKETLYLTDVPRDYVKITSGLGEALPTQVLIVPLKTNETVVGVIEIASFQKISPHQTAFLEKVSESIAANIASLKASERMRQLLGETQAQAEHMRAQEEQMRQHMETLTAAQEEMKRAQQRTDELLAESRQQAQALQAQEEELRQNMEELSSQRDQIEVQASTSERMRRELEVREEVFGHTTILSETDVYGTITYVNSKFCEVSGYSPEELMGSAQNIVRHPDMPRELFRLMWQTIKAGKVFKGIVKNRTKSGGHYWVDATIVPVRDEQGAIVKYIGARYHIRVDALAEQLYREQMIRLGLG